MRFALALALAALAVAPARAADPDGTVRATLPNGLRVVVVPDHLAPVVTTEINYLVGSNDAPKGFPGTAHALEHMMFRGAQGLDRDQLSELGSLLGGDYNADTTETVTQYFYTVPADDLPVALRVEASRMRGATIAEADWTNERGAIEQEVSRDLSSPIYRYLSQVQGILFAGTPYEYDALGTRDSFDKTDAALLRRFYDTWYAPNNAVLVIAGDVDPARALAQATEAFAGIPRLDLPPEHAPIAVAPVEAKTLKLPTNFPVGLVSVAYRMPGFKDRDFAAADILGDVLGSQRGALYGLVPEGRALFSEFQFEAKTDVGYGVALAAFPSDGDAAPLLADVQRVIAKIVADGVPPELVEASRRQELAQLAFRADSITGLAESWSEALAVRGLQSPDDVAAAYRAVTVEDVNRVARLILDPAHAVTAVLTPRDAGEPVTEGGFGGAESFASAPDHPVALPDWASQALASLHLPEPGPAPVETVLANGLRLIVVPEHVTKTVSVFGALRQVPAMQEPPGKDGVSGLVSRMLSYGTDKHDRIAYQTALDDIAARAQLGAKFELKVLTPQFEPGMTLLAEGMLRPAFPAEDFGIVRTQMAQGIAGLVQSPDYRAHRALEAAILPANDPGLRQPTAEGVRKLTLEDVRAYFKSAYRPDLTTIVVAGDVTPEEAKRVVTAAFGGWAAEGPTPVIDLPAVGTNAASQVRVPDPSSVQDSVTLAQTVPLSVTDKQRYALMLGNTILGDGFSSRLYRDLRVNSGYVYSVSSNLDWTRTRGDYSVSFGADAVNVGKARALAVRDMKDMQATPVSDGDLVRAKAQALRRLPMQRASVDALAGLYLRLVDLGLPLTQSEVAAQAYYEMTPEQIQAAFRAWLRPDDLVQVVKGPAVAP